MLHRENCLGCKRDKDIYKDTNLFLFLCKKLVIESNERKELCRWTGSGKLQGNGYPTPSGIIIDIE